jgi:hypothetical protein
MQQQEILATLYANPAMANRVEQERAAFARGGAAAVLDLIATAPPVPADLVSDQTEWPATAAAMLGRRDRLLELLRQGETAHEVYSIWRRQDARLARWRHDQEVLDHLRRLRALPAPGRPQKTRGAVASQIAAMRLIGWRRRRAGWPRQPDQAQSPHRATRGLTMTTYFRAAAVFSAALIATTSAASAATESAYSILD